MILAQVLLWICVLPRESQDECHNCLIELTQVRGFFRDHYNVGKFPGWSPKQHYEVHSNFSRWFRIDPAGFVSIGHHHIPNGSPREETVPVYVYDWRGVTRCSCSLVVWQFSRENVNNSLVSLTVGVRSSEFVWETFAADLLALFRGVFGSAVELRLFGSENNLQDSVTVDILVGYRQTADEIKLFGGKYLAKLFEYQKWDQKLHFRVNSSPPSDCGHSFAHARETFHLKIVESHQPSSPLMIPFQVSRHSTCHCPPAYGASAPGSHCDLAVPQCVEDGSDPCLETLLGERREGPRDSPRGDCLHFGGKDSGAVLVVDVGRIFTMNFEFAVNSAVGTIFWIESDSNKLEMVINGGKLHLKITAGGSHYALEVADDQVAPTTWIYAGIKVRNEHLSLSVGRGCNEPVESHRAQEGRGVKCSASVEISGFFEIRDSVLHFGGKKSQNPADSEFCVRNLNIDGEFVRLDWSPASPMIKLTGGANIGCEPMRDRCQDSPCFNGGICRQVWKSYMCDCLRGFYTKACGRSRENAGRSFRLHGETKISRFASEGSSSRIVFGVRTVSASAGTLLVIRPNSSAENIQISLKDDGSLQFKKRGENLLSFRRQNRLNDGEWHSMHVVMFNQSCLLVIADYGALETEWLHVGDFDFRGSAISLESEVDGGVPACFKDIRAGEEGHILGDSGTTAECLNHDNCAKDPCPANSFCRNDWWSRKCFCHRGHVGPSCDPICQSAATNPCHPPSQCLFDPSRSRGFRCQCQHHYGQLCEHELPSKCPLGTWGPHCTPCGCPSSLKFRLQCTSEGTCLCQEGYFLADHVRGCVACQCSPGGVTRSGCDEISGQCHCRPNFAGRKCDQCASAYSETTSDCSADQLYACPSAKSGGVDWPRGSIGQKYILPCGKFGTATRSCGHKGWERPNLSECSLFSENEFPILGGNPGDEKFLMLSSVNRMVDYWRNHSALYHRDAKTVCALLEKFSTLDSVFRELLEGSLTILHWLSTTFPDHKELLDVCGGISPIYFITSPNPEPNGPYSVHMKHFSYLSSNDKTAEIRALNSAVSTKGPINCLFIENLRFNDSPGHPLITISSAVGCRYQLKMTIKFDVTADFCGSEINKKCVFYPLRPNSSEANCFLVNVVNEGHKCSVECTCEGDDVLVVLAVNSLDWTMRPEFKNIDIGLLIITGAAQLILIISCSLISFPFHRGSRLPLLRHIIALISTLLLVLLNFTAHYSSFSSILILASYCALVTSLNNQSHGEHQQDKSHSLCHVLTGGIVLILYGIYVSLTVISPKSSQNVCEIFSLSVWTLSFIIFVVTSLRTLCKGIAEIDKRQSTITILEHLQWLIYFLSKLNNADTIHRPADILFYVIMLLKTIFLLVTFFTQPDLANKLRKIPKSSVKITNVERIQSWQHEDIVPYSQATLLHQNHVYQSESSQGSEV